jgi:rhodanese-related sulfurtransferase
LAAQQAQEMGLERVTHLGGGLKAWKEAGDGLDPYQKP